MPMPQTTDSIFVYGTLQRGEQRAHCWPRSPLCIDWATVRGELHDLGEYPALVAGEDLILGELWRFAEPDLETTLAVLDHIEWFGQDDQDLYVRQLLPCRILSGDQRQVYTYRFAQPSEIALSPIVMPDPDGFRRWTKHGR